MSLSLSYNGDLARVQVSVTGLPSQVAAVTVERSTNQLYWTTVRGGQDLPVTGGAVSIDDYEFSPDVPNFYRVTSDTPPGLYLPGTAGSYASTPDHASLDITGDIKLELEAELDSWASGVEQSLIGKYAATGNQRSYRLRAGTTGLPGLQWSTAGTSTVTANATATVSGRVAVSAHLDVDNGSSSRVTTFATAAGIDDAETPLGSTVTGAVTSIFSGSAPLEIGTITEGTTGPMTGIVFKARVSGSGPAVANPDFTVHATGTASFADSTGKTWTVHGDAVILGDPVYTGSITPSLGGRAWIKSIKHPFLNRPFFKVLAGNGQEVGRASRGGVVEVVGRSVPVAVTEKRGSQQFVLTVQVEDEQAAAEMDLVLASGDVFFIQVPPELGPHMKGGYVRIGDTSQHREADTIKWRFTLPCRVVAPPGPGVVGGTMTYGALLNLYGSYEAVLAANAAYANLLSLMASPDDLIVL